ncbi:hypothetical protein CAPI_06900 [Corynebacterium capitovis DSM 44611]|uniref:hypothetical protein n=1 Tax=Corynebacterium capitovis TaxID=131081 RepID=UPI0003AAAB21|nr:hypothetical protein [Corynebacterium capitovis]WKD57920.1 hypothetical protein CAPI_06900 [Corynebacterium capitovis DSM 44611]
MIQAPPIETPIYWQRRTSKSGLFSAVFAPKAPTKVVPDESCVIRLGKQSTGTLTVATRASLPGLDTFTRKWVTTRKEAVRRTVAALVCLSGLALASCGSEDSTPVSTITMTTTVSPSEDAPAAAPAASTSGDLASAYAAVLDTPGDWAPSQDAYFEPDGTYSYAIVEATGDSIPDMVVRVNSKEFSHVYLATSTDGRTAIRTVSYLIDGARSAGGGRAKVSAAISGKGLWETSGQSIEETHTSKRFVLSGEKLVPDGTEIEVANTYQAPTPADHATIAWRDSTDRSGLDDLNAGSVSAPTPSPESQEMGNTYAGTVKALSTNEAAGGRPAPNGEAATNVYYVLELDAPTTVWAKSASNQGRPAPREGAQLALGEVSKYRDDSAQWDKYVGRRVIITVDPEKMWWPSDPSLPLGMARAHSPLSISGG